MSNQIELVRDAWGLRERARLIGESHNIPRKRVLEKPMRLGSQQGVALAEALFAMLLLFPILLFLLSESVREQILPLQRYGFSDNPDAKFDSVSRSNMIGVVNARKSDNLKLSFPDPSPSGLPLIQNPTLTNKTKEPTDEGAGFVPGSEGFRRELASVRDILSRGGYDQASDPQRCFAFVQMVQMQVTNDIQVSHSVVSSPCPVPSSIPDDAIALVHDFYARPYSMLGFDPTCWIVTYRVGAGDTDPMVFPAGSC